MARTESNMLALGTLAPDFTLPDTITGENFAFSKLADFDAYLIMFICNHCPYVIHVLEEVLRLARDFQKQNVCVLAISSNDVEGYPQDGPEQMKALGREKQFPFPYLYDESQEVAKAYDAACTPDFYLFDRNKILVYRGRMDESRPQSDIPVSGKDLREALSVVLSGGSPKPLQYPSMGCNIKWKSK